jgi:hypothetical protein
MITGAVTWLRRDLTAARVRSARQAPMYRSVPGSRNSSRRRKRKEQG